MLEIAMKSQFYLSVQNACAKVTVLQILQTASLALIVNFVSISIMKFFIMIDSSIFLFKHIPCYYLKISIIKVDQCKIDFEKDGESCSGHGYCTNDDTISGFTCLCEPGYLGEKCAMGKYTRNVN